MARLGINFIFLPHLLQYCYCNLYELVKTSAGTEPSCKVETGAHDPSIRHVSNVLQLQLLA